MADDDLMPISHACHLLHVSPAVLKRRLEHHQLKVLRAGSRILLPANTFAELKRLCTEVYKPRQRKPAHDIRDDNLNFEFMEDKHADR